MKSFPDFLAAPARRALAAEHIRTLEDLAKRSEREVSKLHGMGPNAMQKLKLALAEKGLAFRR